jgi:hypothetical protein
VVEGMPEAEGIYWEDDANSGVFPTFLNRFRREYLDPSLHAEREESLHLDPDVFALW